VPAKRLRIGGLLAAAAAASLIGPPAAGAATPGSQTASLGPLTATVSFLSSPNSVVAPYSKLRLTITVAQKTIYSAPVTTGFCGADCWPDHPATSFLHVVDLNGDGTTQVVLDLYSGGAHCCSLDEVYSVDPVSLAVTRAERVWGDPTAPLQDLAHDGRLEFLTADDRFAYRFDAYAFSGLPLLIERFSGGRFVDVTDTFGALVTADATRWYRLYRESIRSHTGLGALAAWAADEERLGHEALVARVLARENRHGHLRSDGAPWKGGRAYITDLQRFLARTGYR
jgi:hypothetical protein